MPARDGGGYRSDIFPIVITIKMMDIDIQSVQVPGWDRSIQASYRSGCSAAEVPVSLEGARLSLSCRDAIETGSLASKPVKSYTSTDVIDS